MRCAGSALPALLLVAAAAPLPKVPVYRTFGQWFVACDNTRACVARGFVEYSRAQLELTRNAGASPATLALSDENRIEVGDVRLDGEAIALPAPAWSAADGAVTTKDQAAIAVFIAAARNGRVLTLGPHAPEGEPSRTVPLDGFTAALLMIDAVQARPGTESALIAARGNALPPPAPPLPPAPHWVTPPALTRTELQRLKQQAGRLPSISVETCNATDPPTVYALDAVDALTIRPCYLAAYQTAYVVAILPRAGGRFRPATGERPGMPRQRDSSMDMVEASFEPASGTLSSGSKGRGLADCGSSEEWVWSGGAFRLKSLNYQGQCGGTSAGDWPPLYRTR